MEALLLDAEWKPKEEYRFSEQELATKSTYNGSMAFYNPTLKMIDIPVPGPGPDQVLVEDVLQQLLSAAPLAGLAVGQGVGLQVFQPDLSSLDLGTFVALLFIAATNACNPPG